MSGKTRTKPRKPQQQVAQTGWPRELIALAAIGVVSACCDLTYHKHPHVAWEAWFNFYGFAAAAATAVVLVCCVFARPLLSRPEDYYDQ